MYPAEGIISSYRDHVTVERFQVDFSGKQKVINHAFVNVDEVQIMFTRAAPYNWIHVHHLSVDEETDFNIYRSNMLERPITVKADRLKGTQCHAQHIQPVGGDGRYLYGYGSD